MRMLALPLALALAFCLYLPLPRAAERLAHGVCRLYAAFLRPLARGKRPVDGHLAFALFLLLAGGVCQLAGGWHPVATAVVTAPLLSALTLLPQAGVALGMAAEAAELSDGHMVRNVVLFSVLVYELVGPTLTKLALTAAGEIIPEGRTNARVANKPEFPVSLD